MNARLRHALVGLFYSALIVSLAWYLTTIDWERLMAIRIDPVYLSVGTIVALVPLFGYVWAWGVILTSIGAPVRVSTTLILVYARAWLGRYIPGKAPWILGKIYFASREGIPKSKLAVSSLLEAALQVVAALAISVALLLFDRRLDALGWQTSVLLVVVFIGCVVAVVPSVFNALLRIGFRLLRRQLQTVDHVTWNTIASAGSLYVGISLVSGFGTFFVAKAIDADLDWGSAVYVAGAGILAGALGMLAVFAPSGLGVRDGVILVLLSMVMSTELAFAVTVVSRLWSVVVDALFVAIAWFIARLGADRGPVTPSVSVGED